MGIESSPSSGLPARHRHRLSCCRWIVLPVPFLLVWLGAEVFVPLGAPAQGFRQAPMFAGKMIPDPPSQGQPWTAPATKLPKFLVTATEILFEQGVADPRGCEYRQVEIGDGLIKKDRGFVLPERADIAGRFVVCWDGLVYPALTVGAPADLDRDMNDLAASLKKARQGGIRSPIKLCLLLRLGRADLAETLFAAGTTWTPDSRGRDLTEYGISYLTLATDWAVSAFLRLVSVHAGGEDTIALDTARSLARFRDLASARADEMGFPRSDRQNRGGAGPAPRFYFLTQLDELLRDQERRAKMPPRTPIPRKRGDPTARIAALIRDLDLIDEHPMVNGDAYPGHAPLVRDLIREGAPALAPLLEALESDNRLTRTVSLGRGMSVDSFVHPVVEAAVAALIGILETGQFEPLRYFGGTPPDPAARRALANEMREYWKKTHSEHWKKTHSMPLVVELWYRTLLDDSAGMYEWNGAANRIVQPDVKPGAPTPEPGTGPLEGESLRVGRDPSVTALMLRRARQLEPKQVSQPERDPEFNAACHMALSLAAWDPQAALPLLRDLMKGCRARSDRWLAQEDPQHANQQLASFMARFTEIRVKLGDRGALDQYAAWLRTTTPKMLEYGIFDALAPVFAHPDHPALASAAQWLFNDPKSPWVPLLLESSGEVPRPLDNLVASPLIAVAGFRAGVLAGLADKTPLGTVVRTPRGLVERKIKNVTVHNGGASQAEKEAHAPGVEYPYRRCDLLSWQMSVLEGCPRIELSWPETRRDEAVAACVKYLRFFGPRFTADPIPGERDIPNRKPHLKFPTLGRPATAQDVGSNRAIFSLEGQGDTRLVKFPGFPQPARWLKLKDSPPDVLYQQGSSRRDDNTDGYVWQAEEVRKGDRWERYYGFVGHHNIARAPADEIELGKPNVLRWKLKGGVFADTELVEPKKTVFQTGQPIVVRMRLQNVTGVDRSSPTEFLRPGPDGKPALRQGVNLSLWHWTPPRTRSEIVWGDPPSERVVPWRDAHFEPDNATRWLAPLESFEAMRLDLNDWFDLTRPGRYDLVVTFDTNSGLGKGSSGGARFQVGDDE